MHLGMARSKKRNILQSIKRSRKLMSTALNQKATRIFLGFIFGVTLGLGLYELILSDLEFSDTASTWLGFTMCLMLGIGNAISAQICCISLLTLPSICGRIGRNALTAMSLTFLLAGPIKNLTVNAREVVRVFSCAIKLTYNLTKTKYDLMVKPFQEALLNMKVDVTEVKDSFKSVGKVIKPISVEIEDENELYDEIKESDYIDEAQGDSKRSLEINKKYEIDNNDSKAQEYEKKYYKKLEVRCEGILTHGTERCREIFNEAYNKCYDKVSWIVAWLLCWPMKLTFVCNIMRALGGGSGVCDASKEIKPGFGKSYASLKEKEEFFDGKNRQFLDVKMKYIPVEFHPPLNLADAKEAAETLEEEFKSKKLIFEFISIFIRRLLSLYFLKILLEAEEYHHKYREDFNHDNIWVTSYFLHIDARRHAAKKMTLLPFKKAEKSNLRYPTALTLSSDERKHIPFQLLKIILETVTITIFVLVDKIFYEILMIIHKHSESEYTQTGKHDFTLNVKGTGAMANLVRSILGKFNIQKVINNKISNLACLPNPNKLNMMYLVKIYGTLIIVLILIFLDGYTQRLQRVICSKFYRKIEKQRILYLYNQKLKRRAKFNKRLLVLAKERTEQDKRSENVNIFLHLRFQIPKYFGWLNKVTSLAQRRCVICRKHEGRNGLKLIKEKTDDGYIRYSVSGTDKWHLCMTPDCRAVYCEDCWQDVNKFCLACSTEEAVDISEIDSGRENDDD